MKKIGTILLLMIAFTFCTLNTVNAKNEKKVDVINSCDKVYEKVTDDEQVCKALDIMKGTIADFSRNAILGENLTNKPIKISFLDLGTVKPQYASYDALGMKKGKQLHIYINLKHHDAPPEALAALLSHEALHQDEFNSINEETYAWTMEATVWASLAKKNPQAKKTTGSSLVTRENMLLKMLENANYSNVLIKNTVVNHPGYQKLPQKSPGFD